MSSGWSVVIDCWLGGLPARESGKPESSSGADGLVYCKASQVDDEAGIDATRCVVERVGAGVASLPARKSGKPEFAGSGAGGLARS